MRLRVLTVPGSGTSGYLSDAFPFTAVWRCLSNFRQDRMSDATPHSPGSQPAEPSQALLKRVQARVAEVGLALDSASASRRPRKRHRRAVSPAAAQTPEAAREARSLRRVFLELGDVHRRHRRQTGQYGSPALRNAAFAFKRAPSLTSLAVVAGLLDEAGILEW